MRDFKKKNCASLVFLFGLSLLFVKFSENKIAFSGKHLFLNKIALAEHDDEDKGKEHDDEDDDREKDSGSSTSSSSEPETYKQVIRLPDRIVTKTVIENVILIDSDKDGIPDINDPNPMIPEHLIVNDANENGIDDVYDISL